MVLYIAFSRGQQITCARTMRTCGYKVRRATDYRTLFYNLWPRVCRHAIRMSADYGIMHLQIYYHHASSSNMITLTEMSDARD